MRENMTKLLVLGLLCQQSMSGYDIQNMIQMTDAERWGGILSGSIYYALKKLNEGGYVEISTIENTGYRQKAIYSITEKGRVYFETLICESLKKSTVFYPTSLYSGLTFMNMISDEKARFYLGQQRDALMNELEQLEKGREEKRVALDNKFPPLTELIFDNMFQNVKRQLEFINKVIEIIS